MLRSVLWTLAAVLALVLAGAYALPPLVESFGGIIAALNRSPLAW